MVWSGARASRARGDARLFFIGVLAATALHPKPPMGPYAQVLTQDLENPHHSRD